MWDGSVFIICNNFAGVNVWVDGEEDVVVVGRVASTAWTVHAAGVAGDNVCAWTGGAVVVTDAVGRVVDVDVEIDAGVDGDLTWEIAILDDVETKANRERAVASGAEGVVDKVGLITLQRSLIWHLDRLANSVGNILFIATHWPEPSCSTPLDMAESSIDEYSSCFLVVRLDNTLSMVKKSARNVTGQWIFCES